MITIIVRTLNEAKNIDRFCRGYDFTDKILVADGGSTDNTIKLAKKYQNVEVRPFEVQVTMPDGSVMNPEAQHTNFLIDWAKSIGAEWIISDDCDCIPNQALHEQARLILAQAELPVVHVRRVHIWHKTQYFSNMGKVGSLWAWRPDEVDIYCDPSKDIGLRFRNIPEIRVEVEPPCCLLHDFFPDAVTVEQKLNRYKVWGMPQVHPLEWQFGPLEPLPEWARYD